MTDHQFDTILRLILRNLENCKDMNDVHKEIEFLKSLTLDYLETDN